jgi:hypothetical protein
MSSVVVHTKCVKAYLKFMMKKQRHLLFDMYPMCPSQEARKMVDQLRKSCLTIHHTTGRYCSNCGTGEQEHVRLLTCSKCLETHYCDADCQKRDYELHKEFCFIYFFLLLYKSYIVCVLLIGFDFLFVGNVTRSSLQSMQHIPRF